MSELSKILELIELEYPDHVKIPDYWNELVGRLEDILVKGVDLEAGVAVPGDLKMSVRNADHGRWLKLDGRQLTQAEIEAALSLDAGDAAAFVALMGTGVFSKYGAASTGKVKLVAQPASSMRLKSTVTRRRIGPKLLPQARPQ